MKSRNLGKHFAPNLRLVLLVTLLFFSQVLMAQTIECAQQPDTKSLSWTQATSAAPWPARYGHTVVVFQDRLWLLGGTQDQRYGLGDIWSSADGINWTQSSITDGWPGRLFHGAFEFRDKLWVLGGYSGYGDYNDVWCSQNGIEWERVLEHAPWSERFGFSCGILDERCYLFGGYFPSMNNVWVSQNMSDWQQVTEHAPWSERSFHRSVVFRDELWVLGGVEFPTDSSKSVAKSDVWATADGITWSQTASEAGWCGRSSFAAVVFDSQLWVLGGTYDVGSGPGAYSIGLNDVWSSPDGVKWSQSPDAPWVARSRHAAVVFQNKLWILGGLEYEPYTMLNDVWYAEIDPSTSFSASPLSGTAPLSVQFTDASTASGITAWAWDFGDGETSTDQHPSHVYQNRGLYTVSLTVTSDSGADNETKEGYITVQGTPHEFHSADQNQDHAINLSELLRIIQFMNSDGFHCESGTEDGYAAGPGDTACALHDADYAPPDNAISLSELLRIVQFFNAAGYESCETGEDGFCVITE